MQQFDIGNVTVVKSGNEITITHHGTGAKHVIRAALLEAWLIRQIWRNSTPRTHP